MRFFHLYFKQQRQKIGLFLFFFLIFLAAFWLYDLPIEAVLYPAVVCGTIGLLCLAFHSFRTYKKHQSLKALASLPGVLMKSFPEERTLDDADYQEIIRKIQEEQAQLENKMNLQYADMIEYYTIWAHQIKTPIASMRLTLQNEDTALSRRVSEDLFRIEQYVEMVLMFLRLDSNSTDYVIQKYDLDSIVKQAVRKFSLQFIQKKIKLVYEPVNIQVVTDEKWLLFVIEQVLSNAVKYTPSGGSVTITAEQPMTLCIQDTGIGIAPEDLPRIFEKGYTGYNGRNHKKASGIGLYLSKRICRNLGHKILVNSSPDSGTAVRIYLERKQLEIE